MITKQGMPQAKGKAEAATYILWDSLFVRHEHLLASRSKDSGANWRSFLWGAQ